MTLMDDSNVFVEDVKALTAFIQPIAYCVAIVGVPWIAYLQSKIKKAVDDGTGASVKASTDAAVKVEQVATNQAIAVEKVAQVAVNLQEHIDTCPNRLKVIAEQLDKHEVILGMVKDDIHKVELATNSMKDALVHQTAIASAATGELKGRADQRAESKADAAGSEPDPVIESIKSTGENTNVIVKDIKAKTETGTGLEERK